MPPLGLGQLRNESSAATLLIVPTEHGVDTDGSDVDTNVDFLIIEHDGRLGSLRNCMDWGAQPISQSPVEDAVPQVTDNQWVMQADLAPEERVCLWPKAAFFRSTVPVGQADICAREECGYLNFLHVDRYLCASLNELAKNGRAGIEFSA